MSDLKNSENQKPKCSERFDHIHHQRPRKSKFKKRWWLLADLVIATFIIALLLCTPGRYKPIIAIRDNQISPYLTNELLPQFYNNIQLGEPFDLVVSGQGINDIIARFKWPIESGGTMFLTPTVFFVPDRIVVMGPVVVKGVELIVTIECRPVIDKNGLLNLQMAKVKVGAMNVTLPAKMIAKRIYSQQLAAAAVAVDAESLQAKIAASIFNNVPFEPAFQFGGKKVRVEKITVENEKLTARIVPMSG